MRKRYQTGVQKGKGLEFGAEPPHIKLYRVSPSIISFLLIVNPRRLHHSTHNLNLLIYTVTVCGCLFEHRVMGFFRTLFPKNTCTYGTPKLKNQVRTTVLRGTRIFLSYLRNTHSTIGFRFFTDYE